MYSIYHFFAHLIQTKTAFSITGKLEDFPFDGQMLSARSNSKFPDLAIRLNSNPDYTGGELVELKDSQGYTISSFNSTIPTGQKEIEALIQGRTNQLREQMEHAGNDILSLPIRDVFYLIRGKKHENQKIVLVHGSFFETVKVSDLIQQAFALVLEERLAETNHKLSNELKEALVAIFSDQHSFSRVRDVENASVKLRFRIMTEAKAEGNILDPKFYPQISDNTLNLVLPCHNTSEEEMQRQRMKRSNHELFQQLEIFKIKHPFNGDFLVFQTDLM